MKISKVSTGSKLKYKTFGELKKGDKLYMAGPFDKSIEDVTFTIEGVEKRNVEKYAYTDLNPDKKEKIKTDIILNVEPKFGIYDCEVLSNATYLVIGEAVVTTDKELMFQVIKQYNINLYLV